MRCRQEANDPSAAIEPEGEPVGVAPVVLARRGSSLYSSHEKSPIKRFIKGCAKQLIERLPSAVKDTVARQVKVSVRKLYKVLIGGAIDKLCAAFKDADILFDRKVQDTIEGLVSAVLDAAIGALTEAIESRF